MIHYVDSLQVKPIEINGISTATFTEEQMAFCGEKLKVKSRNEFSTRGVHDVDCPECLKKFRDRMLQAFDCERCKKVLDPDDITALSPIDCERSCLACKNEAEITTTT